MYSALKLPQFVNYLRSNEAKKDIEIFKTDLKDYKLAGKLPIADASSIDSALSDRYEKCMALAAKNPGTAEWQEEYVKLMDSDVALKNKHDETPILMAAY